MEKTLLKELEAVLRPFGDPDAVDENGYVKRKLLLRYFHVCNWHRKLILVLTEGKVENTFRSDFVQIVTKTLSPILTDDKWTTPILRPYMLSLTADIILSATIQWLYRNDMDYDGFAFLYEEIFRSTYFMTRKTMQLKMNKTNKMIK